MLCSHAHLWETVRMCNFKGVWRLDIVLTRSHEERESGADRVVQYKVMLQAPCVLRSWRLHRPNALRLAASRSTLWAEIGICPNGVGRTATIEALRYAHTTAGLIISDRPTHPTPFT